MQNRNNPPSVPAWDDLRVLLALHRHRSFLGAGKALGLSTSTAARRIEALEAVLGRPLVQRSSEGSRLVPDAQPLVALAEQFELGLQALRRDEARDDLAGVVRISLSEGFIRPVIRRLSELRLAHPLLRFEILSETRMADLSRREADIGLRTARSSSPVLIERLLGRVRLALYAAPSYAERRIRGGRLKRADLASHDVVGWEGALSRLPPLNWLEAQGARRFAFRANSYHAIVEAALSGQGLAVLSEPAAHELPGLVRIEVSDAELPEVAIYLAYHREVRRVPRVRLVIDALTAMGREALRSRG